MLRALAVLLPLFLAPFTVAQTTGVPGINDLEVTMPPSLPGLAGSGTSSCFLVPGGAHSCTNIGVLQYRVNAAPTAIAAVIFLSFCPPCGGSSNIAFTAVPALCGGPPGITCTSANPTTNRCFALNLAGGCWLNVFAIPTTPPSGFFHLRIPIPASVCFGLTIWAQAVIVDPCSIPGFHFSQAIGIQ